MSQKETIFSCVPAVSKAALKNRHGKSLLVRAVRPNSNNSKRIYEALNSRDVFALLAPTENLTAFFFKYYVCVCVCVCGWVEGSVYCGATFFFLSFLFWLVVLCFRDSI